MRGRLGRRTTVGGLLALVALAALTLKLVRPPDPPDEADAIRLAKTWLVAQKDFPYRMGYWVRAEWMPKRAAWRVGFTGVRGQGYCTLVEVSRDGTCRAAPVDLSFFVTD